MTSCFVCKRSRNSVNKKNGFSFHRFPIVEIVRQQWMNFVKLSGGEITNLKPESILCSAHFENDCFLQYIRRKLLKENSIPTIMISRQKSAKKYVPEFAFNLLQNKGVQDTERPHSIPVIANNLEMLELGVCALSKNDSFQSSADVSHSDLLLTTRKPKFGSSNEMVNIFQPDVDDTPTKTYLKSMISCLKTENSHTKKKMKVLKQKLRRQKQTIVSLKSVVKVLKEKFLVYTDELGTIENHIGKNKDLITNLV